MHKPVSGDRKAIIWSPASTHTQYNHAIKMVFSSYYFCGGEVTMEGCGPGKTRK